MTAPPVISIVICSYNRAPTLALALESVISQETSASIPFEILIIDDASTDDTEQIIRRATAGSQAPIRYIKESGKGITFARNRGVKEAAGDWIAFFDDDQIAEKDWLSALLSVAQKTGAEIVGGVRRLQFMDEKPHRLGSLTREILGEKYYGSQMQRSNRYTLACTGNVLLRRDIFARIGPFDTDMYRGMSDIDLMRRALDAGISSWYSPRAVVRHLIPPHRLSEDYLKWTCLRVGTNLAHINCKSWGLFKMLFPCLLRAGHAVTLNPLMAAFARISGNKQSILDRKCYRWIAQGSARMALHFLSPGIFAQDSFLKPLEFRIPRGSTARSH